MAAGAGLFASLGGAGGGSLAAGAGGAGLFARLGAVAGPLAIAGVAAFGLSKILGGGASKSDYIIRNQHGIRVYGSLNEGDRDAVQERLKGVAEAYPSYYRREIYDRTTPFASQSSWIYNHQDYLKFLSSKSQPGPNTARVVNINVDARDATDTQTVNQIIARAAPSIAEAGARLAVSRGAR